MLSEASDNSTNLLVTGATSLIGHFLLPRVQSAGYQLHALSRRTQATHEFPWHVLTSDLENTHPAIDDASTLIHLGPLRALVPLLESFAKINGQRVIAFSSTSRFSKLKSANLEERHLAKDLIEAETAVSQRCKELNLNLTLFRPTLIYGAGLDKNVSSITRFIRRFGFFPLVGDGSGLRQPVHADDLAAACIAVIDKPETFGKTYDLVGGETLTYRDMVERLFVTLDKKPRFISVPLPVFRLAMRCATIVPSFSHVTPDMADRMNHPLCFSSDEAKADFGYTNRGFAPAQQDLLNHLSYARL
jgi:nucleoside-diphosphate-sugar epimerase